MYFEMLINDSTVYMYNTLIKELIGVDYNLQHPFVLMGSL